MHSILKSLSQLSCAFVFSFGCQGCGDDAASSTTDGGDSSHDAAQHDASHTDAGASADGGGDGDASAASDGAMASNDGATGNDADTNDSGGGNPDGGGAANVPTFVVVGYQGFRAVSYDLGLSWVHVQRLTEMPAADDEFNLRSITFANGLFVAVGHKILTSPDGKTWTERTNPGIEWFGGVQYGNGRFVAAGGSGVSAYSDDGMTWTAGGHQIQSAVRNLAFGNGVFMAASDNQDWFNSTNGEMWILDSAGHPKDPGSNICMVQFCDGAFKELGTCGNEVCGEGVCVSPGDYQSNKVVRRVEGQSAMPVDLVYGGSLHGVAFGYTTGE
jgi:hypothetical protein